MAPANQSLLSLESGPPQDCETAVERAGHREQRYQIPASKRVWRCGCGGGGGGGGGWVEDEEDIVV